MSVISRLPGSLGRSQAVEHLGLVWTVATAADKSRCTGDQTADALRVLDGYLAQMGTSKKHLVSVTVYLADIGDKAAMNAAWLDWVDLDNAPQRACVGVQLEGHARIEIVAVAST